MVLEALGERSSEHMRREAWRGNVPPHCSFHGWRVRLLGHSWPVTWETGSLSEFRSSIWRFFLLKHYLPPLVAFKGSPEVTSSPLVHFICLLHLIRGSLWCMPVRHRKWCVGLSWKTRVGNGHKDSREGLWRIRTLFWCFAVYEETGWTEERRRANGRRWAHRVKPEWTVALVMATNCSCAVWLNAGV